MEDQSLDDCKSDINLAFGLWTAKGLGTTLIILRLQAVGDNDS